MHARETAILVALIGLVAALTGCGAADSGSAAPPPGTTRVVLTVLPTGMSVSSVFEELGEIDDRPAFVAGDVLEPIVLNLADAAVLESYGTTPRVVPGTPEVVELPPESTWVGFARTLDCGVVLTGFVAPTRRDAALAIIRSARCTSPTTIDADPPVGYRRLDLGAMVPARITRIDLRDTEGRYLEIAVLDRRNAGDDVLEPRFLPDGRTEQINGFRVERGRPPAPADSTPRTTWVVHATEQTVVTFTHPTEERRITDDMIRAMIIGLRRVSEDEWIAWSRPPEEPEGASGSDGTGAGAPASPTGATAGGATAPLPPPTSTPTCKVGAVDPAPELRLWPATGYATARVTVMVHGPNCGSLTTITISIDDELSARTKYVSLQTRVNAAAEASVVYPPGAVPQSTLAGTRTVTFAATSSGASGITEVRGSFVEAGHVVTFTAGNSSVAEVLAVIADLRVATDREWYYAKV